MASERANTRSTNVMENSTQMPNIPYEIIVDILSRLRVKTLVRFRCVSKSWRSLISNPYFVRKHLYISSSDENYTNHCVLLKYSTRYLNSCSLYSIFNEPFVGILGLEHPLEKKPHFTERIVGSCHGLVCLVDEEEVVYLWNPATRETRRLPGWDFQLPKVDRITYGFGYDLSSNDYRVVAVLACCTENGKRKESIVMVFNFRTDSWRRIGDYPFEQRYEPGVFVDGALHWLDRGYGGLYTDLQVFPSPVYNMSWKIVCLDLAAEKYLEIPQPVHGYRGIILRLGCLGGCLCLVANYRGNHVDFWVMKEYGVEKSWTKLITIPYWKGLICYSLNQFAYCRPLFYSYKSGKLLLSVVSGLVLYNPKDESFISPVMKDCQPGINNVYVESLVSPNAGDRV